MRPLRAHRFIKRRVTTYSRATELLDPSLVQLVSSNVKRFLATPEILTKWRATQENKLKRNAQRVLIVRTKVNVGASLFGCGTWLCAIDTHAVLIRVLSWSAGS